MGRQTTGRAHGVLVMMLAIGVTGALVKAAGLTTKYDAEMKRLRGEWRAAQQAEGLDPNRGAKTLYDKYPTPEITLCKPVVIAPGGSAPITLGGKFPARTTFLMPAGVSPRRHKTIETTDIMLQMVASGRAVAALPRWLVQEYAGKIDVVPVRLGPRGIQKHIYLGAREADTNVDYLRAFVELAREPLRARRKRA